MPKLVRLPQAMRLSLVDRVKAAIRSFTVPPVSTAEQKIMDIFFSDGASEGGIVVTERTAYTFSAVFDAVNQISADVAKLPLNLRKRRQAGGTDVYDQSDVQWLFKREPNPDMSGFELRRTMTAHALTSHGGYAEIERDGLGRPRRIWLLTPDRVEPFRDSVRGSDGAIRYGPLQYRIDGRTTILAADMLHIHGLGYDGLAGYSAIGLARKAIALALAAEKFGSAVFQQGSYAGLLTNEDDLDADQQKDVRAEIEKYKTGLKQFLTLFGGKWNYAKTAISSTDAQLRESRESQIEEVARFFNMPLHKLKVNRPGAVSYASVEAAAIDYYTGCLMNWVTTWEMELNRKLIPRLEMRQQFWKHNAAAIVRGDIKSRYDAYAVLLNLGVISADEVRELEDMNPQEAGVGGMYLIQGALVPKTLLEKQVEAKIKQTEMPPPTPVAPVAEGQPNPDAEDDAARARAALAEQAVRAALEQAAEVRTALAAAEARGSATAEELAALRQSEQQALSLAASLTEQAEGRRQEYQAAIEARDATLRIAAEERAALLADRDAAAAAKDTAQAAAERAAAEQARVEARLGEAEREMADAAERARLAEQAAAIALDAQRQAIEVAEGIAASQAAEAAEALAEARRAERDAAEGALATLTAELTSLRAVEQQAKAALATAEAALAERQAQAAALELEKAEALEAAAAERARQAAIAEELTDAQARATAAGATVVALRQADAAGAAVTIAAHRELVVDVMRRMVERESDRLRRAQSSPDKLRTWIETFYEGHEDLLRTALLPAVRVHLAFLRSDDDPHETVRRLAAEHVDLSRRQILTVLDGDADGLAVSVAGLIHRWETERPTALADRLMQKELDHAARR